MLVTRRDHSRFINTDREGIMEMIVAAATFVGLFTLWVVLPRTFLRK